MLHPEPRKARAPEWILLPERDQAWRWALVGVLLYLLFPGWGRMAATQGETLIFSCRRVSGNRSSFAPYPAESPAHSRLRRKMGH